MRMSASAPHAAGGPPAIKPETAKRRIGTAARWVILIAVSVGGTSVVWKEFLRDRIVPKRWQLVIPGELYRSGQLSRTLVERELANHGIRVVVDLTARVPGDSDQEGELRACGALGIEHHRFPLKGDGTGDIRQYAGAVSRIHAAIQEGKPVLVHCVSGVQRTGGVLASYRLLVRGESPSIIHRELTEQGFGCHPVNPGVLTYLNAHMQELSGLLVQQGTLAASPSPLPVLAPATDGGNEQRLAERR